MDTVTNAATEDAAKSLHAFNWGRGLRVLLLVCIGHLLQAVGYSYLNSFFNIYVLDEKGLSSIEYGILIGCYCVVMIVVAPLTAKLVKMKLFNDKTLLLIAWTIDGVFCLILSLAHRFEKGMPFFIGFLIIRILEACGCAMGFVMPYVIIGLELDRIKHIAIPLLETVYGTANIGGPALSGYLFDLGGFPLPFWVLGGMIIILVIFGLFLFPEPRPQAPAETEQEEISVWAGLEPTVIVNLLCTVSSFLLISSNESTLARQLNIEFGMSATECGFLFLYSAGLYSVSGLLLGFFSERVADPRFFMLFGQLISLGALVLQGPLIQMERGKGIVILAQVMLGLGTGPSHVCSYLHSLKHLSKRTRGKDVYAAVSALYTPAASIGASVGPLLAGFILQYYTYETMIAFNFAQVAVTFLLLSSMIFLQRINSKKESESFGNGLSVTWRSEPG